MPNLPCCCLREAGIDTRVFQETDYPTANSVHYTDKVWKQSVITYAWIGRNDAIETIVNAWIDWINTNTGVRLKEIDDYTKSDMRFDVDPADGGRSYYGNDALKISDKEMWTTNFGFEEFDPKLINTTSDMDLWKIARVAPHEFAHALLAALHMQFHSDVVYSDYDRTYRLAQGVPAEEIDRHYALKELITNQSHETIQFLFRGDPESSLLYPFEDTRLAPQSKQFGYPKGQYRINYGLSKQDEIFFKTIHPRVNQPVDDCVVGDFELAQVRKLLREIDNILK